MRFYAFLRPIVLGLCRLLFRVQVHGLEKVPPSGPYVIAPTHRSLLDTPFAGFVTKRRIRFMAKQELFGNKLLAWIITSAGGYPVDRDRADRAALRAAQDAVASGEPTAIFPEGTRKYGREIEDLRDGVAYVALKMQVPIVPVGIGGSEQILASGKVLPRLKRVVVVIGDPIVPPVVEGTVRRSALQQVTGELQDALQARFDEAMQLAGY